MLQTQAGGFVPMSGPSRIQGDPKKFLLVLQYFAGDKEEAEDLALLICELERIKQREVDFLLFARHDAPAFSPDVVARLRTKFNQVLEVKGTRKDAKGHPFGPNGMFYDMVTMFGQQARWLNGYYAFLNLEPDCCPLSRGWLTTLIEAWRQSGKAILGHLHDNPGPHMNGVAVYAIDIWRQVPGGRLGGGSPSVPFDIRHASSLLPLAADTPLMFFKYRQPTITAEELFSPLKGVPAVLYHGVKDASAREAVRARLVTASAPQDFTKKNVYTFFNPKNEMVADEEKAILAVWREGWLSAGWNPVVLRHSDAMRNGRYKEFVEAMKKFPHFGDELAWMNGWLRWLALDAMGGGFYADTNVLPAGNFTPKSIEDGADFRVFGPNIRAVQVAASRVSAFVNGVIGYAAHEDDVIEGKPFVSDERLLSKEKQIVTVNAEKMLFTFSNSTTLPARRLAMEQFLRKS